MKREAEIKNPTRFFQPERCARAWSKSSTCDLCIAACPIKALSLQDGRVMVDTAACVLCGVCTVACPLQAFDLGVTYQEILQRMAGRSDVLVSCRDPSTGSGQHLGAGEVRVPCLGFLDRALLYALAAEGIALRLDFTRCETCAVRPGLERFLRALDEVKATLERNGRAWDATSVTIKPDIPRDLSRRPPTAPEESLRLPRRWVPEKVILSAQALRRLSSDPSAQVAWAYPGFDAAKCTVCGVCAGVCPTGALLMEEGLGTLQLRLADCASCRVCIESCEDNALSEKTHAATAWLSEEVALGSVPVKFCRRCSRFYPAREETCPSCGKLKDMIKGFYADTGLGQTRVDR